MVRAFFFDSPSAPSPRWVRIATPVVLLLLLAAVCWTLLAASTSNWPAVWAYRAVFWHGWLLTIGISGAALVLSLLAGLLLAFARRSSFLPLRSLAMISIEIVRGSPLLVQILFVWSAVALVGINDRVSTGIFILSGFSAAYLAEIIRAGLESVGESQRESARAIGLSPGQTYRFVVFPQAIRHMLPSLAGQFASLIKDSSLLSIIGLTEFTFAAQQVNSATYSTLESFVPLAIGYLLLTLPVSAFSRWLEHRYRYED